MIFILFMHFIQQKLLKTFKNKTKNEWEKKKQSITMDKNQINRNETKQNEMKWNAKIPYTCFDTGLKMVNEYYFLKKRTVSWLRYAWVIPIAYIRTKKRKEKYSNTHIRTHKCILFYWWSWTRPSQSRTLLCSLWHYIAQLEAYNNAFTMRALITLWLSVHCLVYCVVYSTSTYSG